jgi:phage-related protein
MILIRQISWLKAARRDFEDFPDEVQKDAAQALSIAARGGRHGEAVQGRGRRGFRDRVAPSWRRLPRSLRLMPIGAALWVIHAFKKKSKTGINTPQMEVDLVRERLKRLKEAPK